MKSHVNELWIYYDSTISFHRKAIPYAHSVTKYVHEVDLICNKLSKLKWQEILSLLHMRPKQLMNKANHKYQAIIARHDFNDDDWLEILVKNPDLIKAPIAIMNGKAVLCNNPKEVYKLSSVLEDHADMRY